MRFHARILLFVMSGCLIAQGTICMGEGAYNLTSLGGQMNPEEKTALEEHLVEHPDDVESRTKLLGYYFIKGRRERNAGAARARHIIWLIENAPESEVLGLPYGVIIKQNDPPEYDRARRAWLKVIEASPEKLTVLKSASRYFLQEDRRLAEELLLRGRKLASEDPLWPRSLGELYVLEMKLLPAGDKQKATADKAFRQYQLAYEISDPVQRDSLLTSLAKTAFAAGLIDEATKYAEQMLKVDADNWNTGNQIHHGNLILGRIALLSGDVTEAKSRLILAGKTPGSPQLNSFGPNMELAKELLQRGESKVVMEYLELCQKFWTPSNRKIEQWMDEIKSNRIPQFGGNLAY